MPNHEPFDFLRGTPPDAIARALNECDPLGAGATLEALSPVEATKVLAHFGAERQKELLDQKRRAKNLPLETRERHAAALRLRLAIAAKKPAAPAAKAEAWRPRRIGGAVNAVLPAAIPERPPAAAAAGKPAAPGLQRAAAQIRSLLQASKRSPTTTSRSLDGKAVAAAILRFTPSAVRANVSSEAPELFRELRSRMFVFDDLERTAAPSLGALFTAVDPGIAAVALRFASPRLAERVHGAVSPRRSEELRGEIADAGLRRIRVADIDAAQEKVLETALALQREGKIVIDPDDPDLAGP